MKHLIILLFFFPVFIYSQTSLIKGKVVDSDDLNPLSNANIIVEDSEIGTATNEKGEFTIQYTSDEANLIISYIGYLTKKIKIQSLISDRNIIRLNQALIPSQTVLVTGSIGEKGVTPITFSKIKSEEIRKDYTVQDIPQFLGTLPSTTFYSESGNNIGYNYISIRGFDQRRISVSINGIPQNDPEDHNVYWLDFPDLLASTEMIQVQRGAGSGLSGYPAIGGAINVITSSFSSKPMSEVGVSLGSYNTRKYYASFASGLIDQKYSVYAKLSKILSSGYRNSSYVNYNSYHVSAVRYDNRLTSQINMYGGPISDGLAYTGLPKFAIKDPKLRRDNYSYWEASSNAYDYYLERRPDELENFSQPHYELLNEYRFSDKFVLNSALFMVNGNGFFDYDGSWSVFYDDYFRLKANGFDSTMIPNNALIRAQVENTQFGWIPRASLKHTNGELIAGAEIRRHRSLHWGSINYAENLPKGVTKDYRYYQYRGGKDIFNFFLHESFNLSDRTNILAEIQMAYHSYKFYEEKYLNNTFSVENVFLNPRLGINYKIASSQNIYLSLARVSREPRLKNYYDAAESSNGELPQFEKNTDGSFNFDKPLVNPETLYNAELGTMLQSTQFSASANIFLMLFNDEIVNQGQVDRFGQPITGNVERTIHSGIELTTNWKPITGIELILNSTYSSNYIDKGVTYIESDNAEQAVPLDLSGNRIGGFPDVIVNGILRIGMNGFYSSITGRYVGEFYSDNFENKLGNYLSMHPGITDYDDNLVPAYFTADIMLSYEMMLNNYFRVLKVTAQMNNVFNNLYAAYAIGKEFFPSAERNFLFGLSIGL